VHIAGRNQAFTSAVEKLSRHCPATEYQHKWGHTSIYCAEYRKITAVSGALKYAEISHYNKGSNDGLKWHDKS
jgi:hypothetical protein